MGNEETKSNGNQERIAQLELVETMTILNMEVQTCRVDNGRMIRSQDGKKTQNGKKQLSTEIVKILNQL